MNNLDHSSTGVNLELNISYDSDLSQMWFNESIIRLHGDDSFLYINCGNLSDDFELSDHNNYDLKSSNKKEIYTHILEHFYSNSLECFKDDALTFFSKYSYQLTKMELIELVENTQFVDYEDFLQRNFTPKFCIIESRGYSQGDYAEVVIPYSLWEGKAPTDDQLQAMQTEIDYLFWDAPIDQYFLINDDQFYIDEYTKDRYNYDKKETLQIIKDHLKHDKKDYILNWLEENLPDHPSYNG